MGENIEQLIATYSYLAILLGSGLDHTGTPAVLILSVSLAASGKLDLTLVLLANFVGAMLADFVWYLIGIYGGRPVILRFRRTLRLSEENIDKAENMLLKHGKNLIIWGRFLALISRYIAFACGLGNFPLRPFLAYSALGTLLMTAVYGGLTYLFGLQINRYISNPYWPLYASAFVVVAQLLVTGLHYARTKRLRD